MPTGSPKIQESDSTAAETARQGVDAVRRHADTTIDDARDAVADR